MKRILPACVSFMEDLSAGIDWLDEPCPSSTPARKTRTKGSADIHTVSRPRKPRRSVRAKSRRAAR